MSSEKLKSENYTNFGGINSKYSPYVTGPMEFLDLSNLDFQMPGSLSMRWGSTMYFGQTFSTPPTMLAEFTRLSGASYVITGTSIGVWYGATTGTNQGMSFTAFGVNDASVGGGYDYRAYGFAYNNGFGASILNSIYPGVYYEGINRLQFQAIGSGANFSASLIIGNNSHGVVLNDWFFAADGQKFWKFNGSSTYWAQVMPPIIASNAPGATFLFTSTTSVSFLVGLTGTYFFYASYVNNRGVEGPVWPVASINTVSVSGSTAVALGGTYIQAALAMRPVPCAGISAINVYSYWASASLTIGGTATWDYPYVYAYSVPVGYGYGGGDTTTLVGLGVGFSNLPALVANAGTPKTTPDYFAFGTTVSFGSPIGQAAGGVSGIAIQAYTPQFLEVFGNRLFMSGFSTTPSVVWFSDVGEPEGVEVDWNFEVRTNDGDVVTAMKSYATNLYIFKHRSFHVLNGDSPDNFFLREISDQYGCANNNCAVQFENLLAFLDQKGVILWSGAQIEVLSAKIQPIFDRMNWTAAQSVACAAHDKIRNQLVFGIPVDGSSTNNLTVVYDYLTQAWTTYKGFTPSVFAVIQGRNTTRNLFYGGISGTVNWCGPSFLADNGTGFTVSLETRFLHDLGESTQKMFRRLFLNTDSPSSSTLVFGINFYQDFGSTIVLGTTIVLSQFQNRIDYGVSAKSLAFELVNIQTALPLRIHGFTIESRFLRRV